MTLHRSTEDTLQAMHEGLDERHFDDIHEGGIPYTGPARDAVAENPLQARVAELEAQIAAYEGTYQHKCQEQLKQNLVVLEQAKGRIAELEAALQAVVKANNDWTVDYDTWLKNLQLAALKAEEALKEVQA